MIVELPEEISVFEFASPELKESLIYLIRNKVKHSKKFREEYEKAIEQYQFDLSMRDAYVMNQEDIPW